MTKFLNKKIFFYFLITLLIFTLDRISKIYVINIAETYGKVDIYLNQPVGIGEHSDVMGAIDGEINAIAQAHEKIQIINHYLLIR